MFVNWQEMLVSLSHSGICLLGVFGANWWIVWATVSIVRRWGLKRGPPMLEKTQL